MDGYEATRNIRAMNDAYFQNIPIIALTASATSDIKDKVLSFGMSDFISKPFQPDELQSKIADFILSGASKPVSTKQPSNLDLYSEGDFEFKRELGGVLIKNIEELRMTLYQSIEQQDPSLFKKTIHKVKTTLNMLGDEEFNKVISDIDEDLEKSPFPPSLGSTIDVFESLCTKILEGLKEEINSI